MDPDECWAQINDESLPNDERADACDDLVEWLTTKGFMPLGFLEQERSLMISETRNRAAYLRNTQ